MITKKMSLLLGTAMALAATPALADPVEPGDGFASPPGAVVNVGADPASCDGNGGPTSFTTDDAKVNGPDGTATVEAAGTSPGYFVTTTCIGSSQSASYDTNFFEETAIPFFGFANDELESGLVGQTPGETAYVTVVEDGKAEVTTQGIVTENQGFQDDQDNDGFPEVLGPSLSGAFQATADSEIASFDYEVTGTSGPAAMYYTHTEVEDDNANDGGDPGGIGSSTTNYQTSGGSSWSTSTGTSTFDPVSATFDYVAVQGQSHVQNVNGNTVSEFDTDAGTSASTSQTAGGFSATATDPDGTDTAELTAEGLTVTDGTDTTTVDAGGLTTTGSVDAPVINTALINGTGVDGALTLHGGTASTTVLINNSGVTITDSTNGQTFFLDDAGNGTFTGDVAAVDGNFSGDVNVAGTATTGAIVNTGTLDQQGAISNSTGDVTVNDNLAVTGNSSVAGNSTVGGDLDVTGFTSLNGGLGVTGGTTTDTLSVTNGATVAGGLGVTGGTTTDTLLVTGATTTNGITNTGTLTNNGAVNVTGDVTLLGATSDLAVGGTVTVTGLTTTNGISNTGNIATGTLSTTGNATVGGTLGVTGATTLGSTLAVAGNTTVGGTLGVTGLTSTNGISNTGNITNSGAISTATLSTSGNATIGGTLGVTGATTTNGITNTGAITTTTLSTTGAASVGTNLTVGGTLGVTGNTTLGGTLAVAGLTSTNGISNTGNIATGTGNITAGTIVVNGTTNKISGLANATLSATSTEAVTGQQLFATNNALSALDAREAAHYLELTGSIHDVKRRAFQGVAMNMALNAAPLNLDDGEAGIAGGVGVFEGEWGVALRAAGVTSNGVGLGANVGVSKDAVGGAVGASIKF